MQLLFNLAKSAILTPFKIMSWFVMAPVKVFQFMLDNALLLGIYALVKLMFKIFFRMLTSPFILGVALGSTFVFVMIDADRRKKVFEMIGL